MRTDSTPPETTVTSGPSGTVSATDASFAFSSSERRSTFQCRLDGAGWAACTSPKAYAGLADGPHRFEVRATDKAGNVDPTPAVRDWTVAVSQPPPPETQPGFPIRAAFYYPWFPEAWDQNGIYPFTKYTPTLGFYDSSSTEVVQQHIRSMEYGRVEAGIASWWGQGSRTDTRIPTLLSVTRAVGSDFRWSLYYEQESTGDPSPAVIEADLRYIRDRYGTDPAYLRVNGRFVVFVYADAQDGCGMVDRWKQANTAVGAYLVLKVFGGYRNCVSQPDGWHQYAPAVATDSQAGYSFSISPGFNKAGELAPRLARDPARWNQNIRDMVASNAPFQLVTTMNEWGEGTSVETAQEWSSASGHGLYLDALHNDGQGSAPPPGTSDPVIAAAGDIACDPLSSSFNNGFGTASSCRQKYTSDLLIGSELAAVLALGDTQYEAGTLAQFQGSYDPSWGRLKSMTYPAVGNHEYTTPNASGYFDYFNGVGAQSGRAGDRNKGYYSFNIGKWHFVALNSNCSQVGGCAAGSPQETWLRQDLAANPASCTLAYWHHPRFSSGEHGDTPAMQPIWQALYDANADVALAGHDHGYERFTPQNPAGVVDGARGIREFVVGTGGKSHYSFTTIRTNSELREGNTYGVLELTLHAQGYDWRFVPEPGKTFADSGSGVCH